MKFGRHKATAERVIKDIGGKTRHQHFVEEEALTNCYRKRWIGQMKITSMMLAAITFGLFAVAANAQPKNHIGEPLAEVMIDVRCTLTEQEAAEGLKAKGSGMSDLQAQDTACSTGVTSGR